MLDMTLQYLHSVDPFDWVDLSSLNLFIEMRSVRVKVRGDSESYQ